MEAGRFAERGYSEDSAHIREIRKFFCLTFAEHKLEWDRWRAHSCCSIAWLFWGMTSVYVSIFADADLRPALKSHRGRCSFFDFFGSRRRKRHGLDRWKVAVKVRKREERRSYTHAGGSKKHKSRANYLRPSKDQLFWNIKKKERQKVFDQREATPAAKRLAWKRISSRKIADRIRNDEIQVSKVAERTYSRFWNLIVCNMFCVFKYEKTLTFTNCAQYICLIIIGCDVGSKQHMCGDAVLWLLGCGKGVKGLL